jgi:hypothetical protein
MSDRPTPETEAATLNKWQDSCPLQVVPKSLAVALERQRDELLEALSNLLEVWPNKEKKPGWVNRWIEAQQRGRDAIAAVKGDEG